MDKETIENIWNEIIHTGKGEFEYQLLSKESIPQLNIGFNRKNQRCLLLELPLKFDKSFQQFEKENLSLRYFTKERCLCIILNDDFFKDLFDDLILSTYSKIHEISIPDDYSDFFTRHFFKWSAFFENKRTDALSRDQVKGVFGELFYLKNLLLESGLNIDDVLSSWRGPYDEGHDFVFDFIDYEIKTIVLNDLGDTSIFINALTQKGLNMGDLEKYEIYRYTPIHEISYDCDDDNFPKLTRSGIPEEINKVNYRIRLNLIEEYILTKKQF